MASPQNAELAESQRGAWLSIAAYALLTAVKLGVGFWSGSQGLIADGVNNSTDVVASVAVLAGLRIALRPADADHGYGHQKAETVASIVAAAVMGIAGLDVGVTAARAVFAPNLEAPHSASIWVGCAAAVVMLGVYAYNMKLAKRTGSKALAAAAYDNLSDALASLGTVAGVAGAILGWRWADPVVGVLIALVILRTAWHIGYEAAHALTDGFEVEKVRLIRKRVSRVQGVLEVRTVRARPLGNTVAVEVTVSVSPTLSVVEAHRVSDEVERSLAGYLAIEYVHVHVEPAQYA